MGLGSDVSAGSQIKCHVSYLVPLRTVVPSITTLAPSGCDCILIGHGPDPLHAFGPAYHVVLIQPLAICELDKRARKAEVRCNGPDDVMITNTPRTLRGGIMETLDMKYYRMAAAHSKYLHFR